MRTMILAAARNSYAILIPYLVSFFSLCSVNSAATAHSETVENGVRILHNLNYTQNNKYSQTLDIYFAKEATTPNPLVVLVHGGGWASGDKRDFSLLANQLVARGFTVASINYRLTNEAIWPAQALDCKSAVRFLRAHATNFKIDPEKIAIGGHSAGGHLAAFVGATNGTKDFDSGSNLNVNSDVQAVLWFAGIGDLVTRATAPGFEIVQANNSDQSRLIGGPALSNRDKAMKASPVSWVTAKSAPFLFEAGTSDTFVPYAQVTEMDDVLKKSGVYSEVYILKGIGHFDTQFFDVKHLNLIEGFLHKVMHSQKASSGS